MKKITRTIEFTVATVLFANVDERTMEERKVTLAGVFDSEKDLLKEINTDGKFIPLAVVDTERFTKRYVVSVEKFLEVADEITDNETPSDEC